MFNLIKREVIIQKKQLLLFIPFIIFFIVMDSHPVFIFLVTSLFVPFNALAFDEKTNVNVLLNSLPYTRKEIIASRYLGSLVYMAIAIGLTALALFVADRSFTFSHIALGAGLFLLFSAMTFPLFYILKQGYIFPIVMISFFLFVGGGPAVFELVSGSLQGIIQFVMGLSMPIILSGFLAIAAVIYSLSWVVSATVYERKVF
ncbi:ABC-2 transporter permease [Sporosarcina aquimarina]|uniref:ABC-2 transporter permease n=1 Tax=Sporosarcina aquimarina TaxID=114975 RepID=UPI0020414D23|nr:ABC-2 transporter permease [Sporosarcina aquimarina]MCM3756442.1 ABC-2 transporter permease [Sporosarcina aquimarina]